MPGCCVGKIAVLELLLLKITRKTFDTNEAVKNHQARLVVSLMTF